MLLQEHGISPARTDSERWAVTDFDALTCGRQVRGCKARRTETSCAGQIRAEQFTQLCSYRGCTGDLDTSRLLGGGSELILQEAIR